jgi:DNA-binding beta-propeller fold protein YncE
MRRATKAGRYGDRSAAAALDDKESGGIMTLRYLMLVLVLVVAATSPSSAQNTANAIHEKLYISLENLEKDNLAIVDLATFKEIKRLTAGSHPHGLTSPKSQSVLYAASEVGGVVTLVDTIRDEVIKTFHVGFGVEPQNGAVTPDGRFLYQPSYAGYWQVFDTQKEEIIEYIHTLGIGHNTVMAPDGKFVYLLPIAGGEGHWRRPSLGLPRTQPKEVTVVDAIAHKAVATIPVGAGPRPGTISPDGKRLYINVDDLMGFLVIDTAARKVISRATMTLMPDEQAVRSRSHGIAVANDGKEVWTNDVVHAVTYAFDVTVDPPKQIARVPVGRQPYWIVTSKDSKTVYVNCPSDDVLIAFDVATKKEKARLQFPKGSHNTRMLVVGAPRSTTATR